MKTEETKSCETCRLHFDSNKRCNSLIRCIGGSQWESKETKEVILKECDMSLLLGKTISSVQGGDQFIKIITTTGEEFKINADFDVKSDEAYLFVEMAINRRGKRLADPKKGSVVIHAGYGKEKDGNYPCDVKIISGMYLSNGRISNVWSWRRILEEGKFSEIETGYGDFYEINK